MARKPHATLNTHVEYALSVGIAQLKYVVVGVDTQVAHQHAYLGILGDGLGPALRRTVVGGQG
jgi:hypothetical protein